MALLRWLAISAGVLFAVLVLAVGALYQQFDRPGPLDGPSIVVVPKGDGVSAIAHLLQNNGVLRSAFVFETGVRLAGEGGRLQAGEYEFPSRASPRDVMGILRSGKTYVRRLTVPEGLTSPEVLRIVTAAYGLDGLVGPTPDDGTLLPDTYHYSWGDTRKAMILRMKAAMVETVADLWPKRDTSVPLDGPGDAVVLASIVERETGVPDERAKIAGVFYNRLRRGMPLQSDPTVAYAIARADELPGRVLSRPLTRKDLDFDSPYNTYLHKGLPPGPIANPGRAALEAVLHPAKTDALYFVADGSGGHVFADTLAQHNRNVRKWRHIQHTQHENGKTGKDAGKDTGKDTEQNTGKNPDKEPGAETGKNTGKKTP